MSDENKKLLYVVNNPKYFLSHRLSLAKAALAAGFEVHVATPEGEGIHIIEENGLKHHTISMSRSGVNPWREVKTIWQLWQLYCQLKPNVVHHVTVKPVFYGSVAAWLAQVPRVINAVTGLGFVFISSSLKARFLKMLLKAVYRLFLRRPNVTVIFQNQDDLNLFVQLKMVNPIQAVLIRGSGVCTEHYQSIPEPEGPVTVLLPARLLWDKGVGEFVKAARLLKDEPIAFAMAGMPDPGNPASITQKDLDAWVAEGVVEHWGWIDDMREAFARCHIVCLPSYREGLPRVLIEAAACGRAIIATDVPGCREVVRHGKTGFLVPEKQIESLASTIQAAASSPSVRASISATARGYVKSELSERVVNAGTLSLYVSTPLN